MWNSDRKSRNQRKLILSRPDETQGSEEETCEAPAGTFGDLTGKRAFVSGSSSGIGRAIALEFARAGADVLVHFAKSSVLAEKVAQEIRDLGQDAVTVQQDFDLLEELPGFVDRAFSIWNGLDIWVANAGVDLLTGDQASASYEVKLQRLLSVDVQAGMLSTKDAGNRMAASSGGTILTIGWDQADRGMEGASGELFAAAKNAVMGFSRSLAVSLAPKVRVNCIAPGWIRTAWGETASDVWQDRVIRETPLRRWGLPDDIAKLARFLVSDDAAYLTGQVINCNGGAVR